MDNLSEAEEKRRQLIVKIQEYKKEGCSISEISRRTGKARQTISKYLEGSPDTLCCSNKAGMLNPFKNFIIKCLTDGMTQSKTSRQLTEKGYIGTDSNARNYIRRVIKEYNIPVNKYCSSSNTKALENNAGSTGTKFDYITRKGLFQHLWMDDKLNEYHRRYIFDKYPILYRIDKCIREFRDFLSKKSLQKLHLFIESYKNSEIKEFSTFVSGLEKDIDAVENAVVSDLSNGFVEGTNSKVKMIKHTMYGRCVLKLLSAKLMYKLDG